MNIKTIPYARIQSILRKAKEVNVDPTTTLGATYELHAKEKELIKQIQLFQGIIQLAADNYGHALIANYANDLVKEFNSFYRPVSILGETKGTQKMLRVQLSEKAAEVILSSFALLSC